MSAISTRPRLDTLLLLQAIDRAGDLNPGPGGQYEYRGPAGSADCEDIARHLGAYMERSDTHWWWSGTTPEQVRSACKRLMREDLVAEHRPRDGKVHYSVAPEGDALLKASEDELPELPESPDHRDWRTDRERALRRIDALRQSVRDTAHAAYELADSEDPFALCIDDGYEETHRLPCRFEWHNVGTRVEQAAQELIRALLDISAEEPA